MESGYVTARGVAAQSDKPAPRLTVLDQLSELNEHLDKIASNLASVRDRMVRPEPRPASVKESEPPARNLALVVAQVQQRATWIGALVAEVDQALG